MTAQLPTPVMSLLAFLEKDCRLLLEEQHMLPSFGDAIIVLRGQSLRVRLLRDRSNWFVEVSSEQAPAEWYDMALLQEQITSQVGQDVLSFDEQAAFLRANWQRITTMLTGLDARELRAALEQRRQERVKRRFPMWSS